MSAKPWEAGYVTPPPHKVMSKAEAGALGGLTGQARKRAGLPPKPIPDGTAKKGAKRTNTEKQAKLDAITEDTIPLKKKLFYDQFIYEYLHDFNASMAWLRAGGSIGHATSGGHEALRTGYVQTQLRLLTEKLDEEQMVTRGEVLMGIKKEANYYGEDGSSAARVRAWGMLAKIKGMDAPVVKPIEDDRPRGGVMQVPLVSDVEWAEVAGAQQLLLKQSVRD